MLLEVLDLTITLGRGLSQHTVHIPELRLEHGEMAVLLGRSGSGKSAFLRTLAGLWGNADVTVTGLAAFYDEQGEKLSLTGGLPVSSSPEREEIFYLFQDPRSYLHPTLSVAQHGVLLEHRFPLQTDVSQRFKDALEVANLSHKYHAFVSDLSGGEAQRLMLAIARVLRPRLLLADEPLSAQDRVNHAQLRAMINSYVCDPINSCGLLLVTHEIRDIQNAAAQMACNKVYVIEPRGCGAWQCQAAPSAKKVNDFIDAMAVGQESCVQLPDSLRRFLVAGQHLGMIGGVKKLDGQSKKEVKSPVLEVTGLGFDWRHPREKTVLLRDITFTHSQEINLGLMGLSGVGKSTLAEALMRLLSGVGGRVVWFGEEHISEFHLRRRLQYVFQDCERAMAWEIGEVGRVLRLPLVGPTIQNDTGVFNEAIAEITSELKLDGQLDKDIAHLSGGQLRRAYIARALIALLPQLERGQATVLILDEATVGLDLETQYALLEFLRRFSKEIYPELSIVAISHDPYVLRYLCQMIFVLHATEGAGTGATIVEQLSLSDIDVGIYQHNHTKMLLSEGS